MGASPIFLGRFSSVCRRCGSTPHPFSTCGQIGQARRGQLSGKSLDDTQSEERKSLAYDMANYELTLTAKQDHDIFWRAIDHPIIIAALHEKMDILQWLNDRL